MPRYIDAYAILPEPTKADRVLADFKRWQELNGVSFSGQCDVFFNDSGDMERESELVSSEDDGLGRIFEWPAFGGMELNLSEQRIVVVFHGGTPHCVDVITLSMNATPYMSSPKVQRGFEEAIAGLHEVFKAKRTAMDYELLSPASWLMQEVERVRSGVFEGRYALDLRKAVED